VNLENVSKFLLFPHSIFFSDAKKITLDKVTKQFFACPIIFSWHKFFFNLAVRKIFLLQKKLRQEKNCFVTIS